MKKGFTLVELLVVIALIGLLIAIAIPSGIAISNKIKKNMLDSKIELIESGAIEWGQKNKSKLLSGVSACSIEEIVNDSNVSHCLSKKLSELLDENALEEDKIEDGKKVLINPVTNTSLNDCGVEIYIKNKRVYAQYNINGTNCGYEKEDSNEIEGNDTTQSSDAETKKLTIKLDYTYFIDPGLQSGYGSILFNVEHKSVVSNPNECICPDDSFIEDSDSIVIDEVNDTISGVANGVGTTSTPIGEKSFNFEADFSDYQISYGEIDSGMYPCICRTPTDDEYYNNFCNYNNCENYPLKTSFSIGNLKELYIYYWESEADLASNGYSIAHEDTIIMNQNSTIKQVYVSGYNISYDYSSGNLILKEEAKNNCKNKYYSIYGEKYELYCNYGDFSLNVEDSNGNITSYSIDESIMTSYPYNFDGVVLNKISVELE